MVDSSLVTQLAARATEDDSLGDRAKELVLAALESPDELADLLSTIGGERGSAGEDTVRPVTAYLREIRVEGFRGIGSATTLSLHPGPGLTIVTGRNGSGKSSFAEGLETALTGGTFRWGGEPERSKQSPWATQWRNLHHRGRCSVAVELAVDGAAENVLVGIDWDRDADYTDQQPWTQPRTGTVLGRRVPGRDPLGWAEALRNYRPIMSYQEMNALLHATSMKLHEAIARILGLDRLTSAINHLKESRKAPKDEVEHADKLSRELRKTLADVPDDRAQRARTALGRKRDLELLTSLATGTDERQQETTRSLRILSTLTAPAEDEVRDAADTLRAAHTAEQELTAHRARTEARRLDLLRQALELHAEQGERDCPVCGTGRLDGEWRRKAEDTLQEHHLDAERQRRVAERTAEARRQARALLESVPTPPATEEPLALPALPALTAATNRWFDAPTELPALADHLLARRPELAAAMAEVREQAAAHLDEREERWAPVALELSRWLDANKRAEPHREVVRAADQAVKWLERNETTIRDERVAELSGQIQEVWASLRQESNVSLGNLTLEGRHTRRTVRFTAGVDGEEGSALGLTSQGESHALSLSLFLPRATAPSSPFRFVVLDDPIQAFDLSKIDGFVRVLERIAQDRQVVVFTHDDRLPQAVRTLGVKARVIEVTRGMNSTVKVRPCPSPAFRHVEDARALVKDPALPVEALHLALPGICRLAVESAAKDLHDRHQSRQGMSREERERRWEEARLTRERVTLALGGQDELNDWCGRSPSRNQTLALCNGQVHKGLSLGPEAAVKGLEEFVAALGKLA
ncbi:recombinase RecF [Actinoalloteichus sp. AHMU CJ021]|uniref:AAA family ATPase n=1 Tax=Actinoalloteichus sp. AHMU CJ021 TaxID=2072503 RepID=UPI000CA08CB3|nr:recombinase RecF [Actinoalloteichus sp. AHMU CJ021]